MGEFFEVMKKKYFVRREYIFQDEMNVMSDCDMIYLILCESETFFFKYCKLDWQRFRFFGALFLLWFFFKVVSENVFGIWM